MPKVRDGDPEHQVATVQEWRRGATPRPRTGVAADSYPMSEVWGGGQEEQPHIQGAAAAWAQEGREELLHIQGGVAVRRYPSSKVRSSGCTLLEEP